MESRIIDLATIIGVYPLTNTGTVLVHAIDYGEDKVLASINGVDPCWCDMKDEYMEASGELEEGFTLGELFIPFADVMRFFGGNT